MVASLFACKREGYFIDLAANAFKFLSNTLMLERDFGWGGICIEANREYIYGLASRRCSTVWAAVGAPKDKQINFCTEEKGVVGHVEATAHSKQGRCRGKMEGFFLASFGDILRKVQAPKVIDYMSLDVEGAEQMVMEEFPFDEYKIMLMSIETTTEPLQESLKKHGYQFLKKVGADHWWVHSSLPELEHFSQELSSSFPTKTCMDNAGYHFHGAKGTEQIESNRGGR